MLTLTPLAGQHRLTVARPAMGTPWSVTVYAADTLGAQRVIDSAYARIEAVEQRMSDYRPDSEINRLVQAPPGTWQPVSDDLYRVLDFSLQLARRSGGAFDPTVGPLSRIWRRAFRHGTFPDTLRLREAHRRVSHHDVQLSKRKGVRLDRDDIQLDLGGVAKGYALDAAGRVLRAAGLTTFLIDGGGDLLLGDPPPGRPGWRVDTPIGQLDTARVAIATSGDTFRFLTWKGTRYSHLIDPRTGLGIVEPRSVTVLAPTGMEADGLASAASVVGEADWIRRRSQFSRASISWSLPGRNR